MPFCNKCGTEVAEGINFCGKCGNALNSAQSPSQTNYDASGGSGGTPFVMKKNTLFRIIGKLGYIFVVIGFCMPIAVVQYLEHNGFELANRMFDLDKTMGLLMIAVFVSAIVGIIIGILLFIVKNINTIVDWITAALCVASGLIVYRGLIVYFGCLTDDRYVKLQSGAYVILTGWIIALVSQFISSIASKGRKPTCWKKWDKKDWVVFIMAGMVNLVALYLSVVNGGIGMSYTKILFLVLFLVVLMMMVFHRKRVYVANNTQKPEKPRN